MRFKFGLMIGFAAGYYLGARAGRERYVQIQRWLRQAKESDLVEQVEEKAKDLVHGSDDGGRVGGPATVSPTMRTDLPA